MPHEYYLEPEDESRSFPPRMLEEMFAYVRCFPCHVCEDGTCILFESISDRERRLPRLLAEPRRNDYLQPFVHIRAHRVILSAVLDRDVDRYLHQLVLWCQARWPCTLHDLSGPVPPEALLDEP